MPRYFDLHRVQILKKLSHEVKNETFITAIVFFIFVL